jgi:uncharacterized protein YjeT (DUF2065 family)
VRGLLRRPPWTAALALGLALATAGASAHVVYGTRTLRLLTLESDLVVRMRIVDPGTAVALGDSGERETLATGQVLDTLKGTLEDERLRFVQHGHGTPTYEPGEEAVIFLQRIERSRELGASAVADHVRWVSLQEAGARYLLDDAFRGVFLKALRDYAALEALPIAQQPAALRRLTVELLASPDPRLASSAVRDLALAGEAPIVTADDVPALVPLLASPATPVGVRVALLAELERRGLVEGPPHWARLVRETRGRDRFNAVRAAAAHPSEPVTRELLALLGDDDPLLVSTAAISLGALGNETAVEPLAKLLASDEHRVRLAAIRGLGRIGTPSARKQLAQAAAQHPDPGTRRRAGAEIRILGSAAP